MRYLLSTIFALMTLTGFSNAFPSNQKMILTKIKGEEVSGSSVYLTIDTTQQIISGKSGCNVFNIHFSQKGNRIWVGSGATTMKACDEQSMKLENDFLSALQGRKFKVKTKGNTVVFKNGWGKTILEFQIQTPEDMWSFIGKHDWKLLMLDNVAQDYKDAAIRFNLNEKKVSGNTGCNSFFGSFKTEGEYISFEYLGSTRKACIDEDVNKTENQMLQILSNKKLRYDVTEQTLNLYNEDKLVMMFGLRK